MSAAKKRRRTWAVRDTPPPRASYEELEIRTEDGVALRAVVDEPPADVPIVGTCVFAHAMFARKSAFGHRERPGLTDTYARLGWRTVAFDFRGHGDSALPPGVEWGYDDLVRFDLPAVVDCARARSEGKPLVVLGHSLGGHVALAAQGSGRARADAIVCVGSNVWIRALERSRLRWTAKRVLSRAMERAAARFGRLPARMVRLGSDDVPLRHVREIARGVAEGRWQSADGTDDYLAELATVDVPVCAVVSSGDRLTCHPSCGEAMVRRCRGPVEVIRVRASDDGTRAPNHRELGTSPRAKSALVRASAWVLSRLQATQARP